MLNNPVLKQKSVRISNEFLSFIKRANGLEFVKNFYGINLTEDDIKDFNCFLQVVELKSKGLGLNQISKLVGKAKSTIEKWVFNQNLPPIIQLLKEYKKLGTYNKMKWLSINSTRGGIFIGPWVRVPEKINNYEDVLFAIRKIKLLPETYHKSKNFGIGDEELEKSRPYLFAYLLGILIGDSSKDEIKRRMRITRRISISLSKAHSSNKILGEFVSMCANSIGLRMSRIKDMPKGKKNTNLFYRWNSQSSPLVQCLFSTYLGLKDYENTTYNPIKADWILTTPRRFRIWFLQGLADSDGFVDLSSLQAGIITHPNTEIIDKIFKSLGINTTRKFLTKDGMWCLMININDAYRLPVFNFYVKSYRYEKLEKIVKAKRISGHWPKWLSEKIDDHIERGFSGTKLVEKIMNEDNVAVRAQHINKRVRKFTQIRGEKNKIQ